MGAMQPERPSNEEPQTTGPGQSPEPMPLVEITSNNSDSIKSPRRKKRHATPVIGRARKLEIVQLRLNGAQWYEVLEWIRTREAEPVTEKNPANCWTSEYKLSLASVFWYIGEADKIISELAEINRDRAYKKHLAQRQNLYAKAVNMGDIGNALRVLDSMAKLQDLFPSNSKSDQTGGSQIIDATPKTDLSKLTDEELEAYERLIRKAAAGNGG